MSETPVTFKVQVTGAQEGAAAWQQLAQSSSQVASAVADQRAAVQQAATELENAGAVADAAGSKFRAFGMGIAHVHRGLIALNPEVGGIAYGFEIAGRSAEGLAQILGTGIGGGLIAGGVLGALVAVSHMFGKTKKDTEDFTKAIDDNTASLGKNAAALKILIDRQEEQRNKQLHTAGLQAAASGGYALGQSGVDVGITPDEAGKRIRALNVQLEPLTTRQRELEAMHASRAPQQAEIDKQLLGLKYRIDAIKKEQEGLEQFLAGTEAKPGTENKPAIRKPRGRTINPDFSAPDVTVGAESIAEDERRLKALQQYVKTQNQIEREANELQIRQKNEGTREQLRLDDLKRRQFIENVKHVGLEEEKHHAASIKRYEETKKRALQSFTSIGAGALHMGLQALQGQRMSAAAVIGAMGDMVVADGERHVIQGGAELLSTFGAFGWQEVAAGTGEIALGVAMGATRRSSAGGGGSGGGTRINANGQRVDANNNLVGPAAPIAPRTDSGAQNITTINVHMPVVVRPDAQTGYHIQKHLDQAARQGLIPR